jgi:hypothetical protein
MYLSCHLFVETIHVFVLIKKLRDEAVEQI